MKIQHTLLLASVFTGFFLALTTADAVLLNKPHPAKRIVLSADSETQAEVLSAKVSQLSLGDSALQQIHQYLDEGHALADHHLLQNQPAEIRVKVIADVVDYLGQHKAYDLVVQLAKPLSVEQRLQNTIQFRYALALAKQGDSSAAIAAYQANLAYQPNHQATAINLGLLLNKAKQFEQAETVLLHAIAISSGERKAKAMSVLASSYSAQGDMGKAAVYFERSIQYRPDHATTWYKLAKARQALNEAPVLVIKTYQRTLALKPDYPRAAKALGLYQLQLGDYQAAANHLLLALEGANRDEQLHLGLAWSLTEMEQWNGARKQWQWLSNNASSKTKRLQAAHFEKTISNKPQQLKALPNTDDFAYSRAVLAQLQNDTEAAKRLLQTLEHDPHYRNRVQLRLQALRHASS